MVHSHTLRLRCLTLQVVAGMKYAIVLTAQDATGAQFDVKVSLVSRPWLEARNDAEHPAWQLITSERLQTWA